MPNNNELPVAIIGAGPIGLAAAAQLVKRGVEPLILESGPTVGANVVRWGHVRIFSPWRYSIDAAARELLERHSWVAPSADGYPTGRDLVELYLNPLGAVPELAAHLRLNHQVRSVARLGFDKLKTKGREAVPFVLSVLTPNGGQELLARAVIDASGTYDLPNPIGANGTPAIGEKEVSDRIHYGIADVLGRDRFRYAGRRVLVVGSGHSAFGVLIDLVELATAEPGTQITWLVRSPMSAAKFGGGESDALPARGALGTRLFNLISGGAINQIVARIQGLRSDTSGVYLRAEEHEIGPFDQIVAATGFRPNLAPLRELRLNLDEILEAPAALAPLIDPNVHSCGTVQPHGAAVLTHPERDFYIAGMKSYGRAPTFLMLTGYEQVRSIASALAGDTAGAEAVELILPKTGVCSGGDCCAADSNDCGSPTSTCCGTTEKFVELSTLSAR